MAGVPYIYNPPRAAGWPPEKNRHRYRNYPPPPALEVTSRGASGGGQRFRRHRTKKKTYYIIGQQELKTVPGLRRSDRGAGPVDPDINPYIWWCEL